MIFSELYSAYYQAVAAILRQACTHPLDGAEMRSIIEENAFGESVLNIEPALMEERWQLILPDGTTPIRHVPVMPLTRLQKRWLKAVFLDPRIRLFYDTVPDYPDVEPLFTPDFIRVYDRYLDGDPYEDPVYIQHFRTILKAVRERKPLELESMTRGGTIVRRVLMPEYLEYSEKDDKFRLVGTGCRYGGIINVGRIVSCGFFQGMFRAAEGEKAGSEKREVELEVYSRRNALERVLMHFAHFEKQAVKEENGRYRVTIVYDMEDETEMLIRILAFGPLVKVTAPDWFVQLIRERLLKQKSCGSC